ncbi:acetylcholine receptor subunit beta-type unc-29 [Patella vulgata]|uniref:acetylcholine receptor subunit beta-type unc-29 n=1 Tax=Patella vulgata TaxID=6465 RepID=UPI00217FB928|nr:acetylcholine receptor subunit beta-type unc-29 [Patella vulgata]
MHSVRLSIKCHIDLIKFPFDTQTCVFIFESWIYHGNILNVTYLRGDASKAFYVIGRSRNSWKIINNTARLKETYYSSYTSEPDQTMVFTVVLERKPIYYIHVYILPAVILSLLIPFQLFLPPESRERLTLGSVLILCNILMIFKLQEILPKQLFRLQLLGVFYTLNLIWSFFASLATICVLNVHNRGPRQGKVPEIIRWIFLRCLKRIVCLGNDPCYSAGSVSMKGLENPMSSSSTDGQKASETENGSKLETDVEDLNRQIRFFTRRARMNEVKEEVVGEWHQVALVIDRVILFLFLLSIAIYTAALLG